MRAGSGQSQGAAAGRQIPVVLRQDSPWNVAYAQYGHRVELGSETFGSVNATGADGAGAHAPLGGTSDGNA